MPTIRDTGQVEDCTTPWHRIFRGRGDVRHIYGGWMFPSAFSRRSAPEGRHLLTLWTEPLAEGGKAGWPRWADAERALETGVEYLAHYYADLEECVEWSRYQYVSRPAWLSWYTRPIYRHPIKISTVSGLYVGSATAEGTGSFLDVECAVGLEAAELADTERGHLVVRAE
jgi:hypothetical protein